ncbi:xanthine dehydrogenase accessory protein XdhC [Phaeovulum sp.]|uniref:xanthine dehydrogenase accessory protein XdhC n=1 Tax=Phaeovulum sp. TaxID=2934796 RepID=UPI002730E210|nr:xanthine dehydrogenase accessory protein XdhC [Phaeovulum sp.]MDP1668237.1 xanthine dehydrogenase accessory protein XdhC [Phaeovulum sp.]MDZ4118085.1 xanthine dehydrogenase accessory protein XdhC [Phaeovulum sp.]
MSLNPEALARAVALWGPFTRVLLAEVKGSAPREAGAEMLVWAERLEGTIGGGALEWRALAAARAGFEGVEKLALGPGLGQCCGGAVTLVYERLDAAAVAAMRGPVRLSPLAGAGPMPAAAARLAGRAPRGPRLIGGWLAEPVAPAPLPVWVWGAGHVGRALVSVLAPLPQFALTWVDFDAARFGAVPPGVRQLVAADPAGLVPLAPPDAQHLVVTHAHALDLALCHAILQHGFSRLGLIGSASKAARFASRLAALGHGSAEIARITCPIGAPDLGKHPQAIAVGVVAALLKGTG